MVSYKQFNKDFKEGLENALKEKNEIRAFVRVIAKELETYDKSNKPKVFFSIPAREKEIIDTNQEIKQQHYEEVNKY